jgi:hypothetical protein
MAVFCLASFYYYLLIVHDSYDVFSSDGKFSRIIIPDSFIYVNYSESTDNLLMLFSLKGTKNYIGPAFLAQIMKDIQYGDIIVNIFFIGIAGIYFIKILRFLQINSPLPLIMLFLNPESIYYSQGFLKEIPSLLCVTMFVYYFLKRRYRYLIPIILVAGVLRYQIGLILILILLTEIIPTKYKLKAFHAFLFLMFALLPVAYKYILPMHAYYSYREDWSGWGIGSGLVSALQKVPFFGYIGLPIRSLQNLFEPFPHVELFYGGEGIINIYFVVMAISLFMMIFFYSIFIIRSFYFIVGKYRNKISEPLYRLLFIIIIFVILTGINPWTHHRYAYPIIPFISFIYFIKKDKKKFHIMTSLFFCTVYLLIISVELL